MEKFISGDGYIGDGATFALSDYIEVEEDASYSFVDNSSFRIVFFNASKVLLSSLDLPTSPIITPAGTNFVRFHFNKNLTLISEMQFEKGLIQSEYQSFGKMFLDENIIAKTESNITITSHLAGKKVVFLWG